MKDIICNQCGKSFSPSFSHKVIGKDENGGNVTQTYFICPHCEQQYNAGIKDSVYEELLKEYRRLAKKVRDCAGKNMNSAVIKAAVNRMNRYEAEVMKPYYCELKKKWNVEEVMPSADKKQA